VYKHIILFYSFYYIDISLYITLHNFSYIKYIIITCHWN